MEIKQNYDLTQLNTFGVRARAKFFTEISTEADLTELFTDTLFKNNQRLFLGGGSNILFTRDFDGMVILNKLKGIEILNESSNDVLIRAMSGEVWHDLVLFAVDRGYWGIENLSLIPGTVGAAPMQNIGAYGAELKNVLESIETYEIENGDENKKKIFKRDECELGYRDSVFKNKLKGKYFIVSITLKLSKLERKNIKYKILQEYIEKNKIEVNNSKDISVAVSEIRRRKLPDPKVIGNAGSFFKNVFIGRDKTEELKKTYPDMPYFEEGDKENNQNKIVKVPAAWLVEQCGWKGKRVGNAGVHEKQALVLVNHGGATGDEIKNLAELIIKDVREKFGLELVPEVNLI
jgi:UDP-N-acetylmuramate dehydrogenase